MLLVNNDIDEVLRRRAVRQALGVCSGFAEVYHRVVRAMVLDETPSLILPGDLTGHVWLRTVPISRAIDAELCGG
jgi:hypothetical protein